MSDYLELTRCKLTEIRPLIKLFGLDFDGTVYDNIDYKLPEVLTLTKKILTAEKSLVFATARAATALAMLAPALQDILAGKNYSGRLFIGGGNGVTLHEITKYGLIDIYNHGFALPQVESVVKIVQKIFEQLGIRAVDLVGQGMETLQKFLQTPWGDYIPKDIIDICRPYNGEFFTEQAKITFVLPENVGLRKTVVTEIGKKLGKEYSVVIGDETYVHITKALADNGKTVAVKTVLDLLGLALNQVVTFGDMPNDNDAGLLSFPYSFTNARNFVKCNQRKPPYILSGDDLSPIDAVYEAIDYLLK